MTPLQQRFADEYLVDLNATAAYKRAGGQSDGAAASVGAAQLLRNIKVSAYIEAKKQERAKVTGITAERVLAELAKLAFYDPRKFYDDAGNIRPIHTLDDETAAAVSSFEVVETEGKPKVKKIKGAEKRAALELLGRHLAMFNDKLKLEGKLAMSGTEEALSDAELQEHIKRLQARATLSTNRAEQKTGEA